MSLNSVSNMNIKLVKFLRELAVSIENEQLEPTQLQSVSEFFMIYKFREQAVRSLNYTDTEEDDLSDDELLKFISLGWYVYRIILKNKM